MQKVISDPKFILIKYPITEANNELTVPGAMGEFPVGHTLTIIFI